MSELLEPLLKLLSENSRYPKYQHERRIDLFLNFYLSSILAKYFNVRVDTIIPEFPLKKESSQASTNVDFLAYSDASKIVFFVEIKTDDSSFKESQLDCYCRATEQSWRKLVEDIVKIRKATAARHRKKYDYLLSKLQSMAPEVMRIVYIGPECVRKKVVERSEKIMFISLESLRDRIDMSDNESHNAAWNVIRQYVLKPQIKELSL